MKANEVVLKSFNSTGRGHKGYRWRVYYTVETPEGKNRRNKIFKTKADALKFMSEAKEAIAEAGESSVSLSATDKAEAYWAVNALAPYKTSLKDAVKAFIKNEEKRSCSLSVSEIIPLCIEEQERTNNSPRHIATLRQRLARFEKKFGECRMDDIDATEITKWLNSLKVIPKENRRKDKTASPKKKRKKPSPVSRTTWNGYKGYLLTLFSYAVRMENLAENPVKKIKNIKSPQAEDESQITEIAVFTPSQLAIILEKAPDDLIPFLVIGAFAGVRASEIKRLDWKHIKMPREATEVPKRKAVEGKVTVPAELSKTGDPRAIRMYPVLVKWLEPYVKSRGRIIPKNFKRKEDKLHEDMKADPDAGWVNNGLRKSFVSYATTKEENLARVSEWAGHNNTATTSKYYYEDREDEEAEQYFSIYPEPLEATTNIKEAV